MDCNLDNGMTEYGKKMLFESFQDSCYDQQFCDMKIKYGWFTEECRRRLAYYAAGSQYNHYAEHVMDWDFY